MKSLFKNKKFRAVLIAIALMIIGAVIAAGNGYGETAQTTIVGTVFAPCHYVASKVSAGISKVSGNVSGNSAYEKRIADLQKQVGSLQGKLTDYENLKRQNDLYKEALGLKEENKNYTFVEASVIGRDSADIFDSFVISKGTISGIEKGDAVVYGKYLIGIIEKAYPTYSVVQTLYDSDFSVSAYEIITNKISYVKGDAALAQEGLCEMANLETDTSITYGSIICTAGVGGTIPKDLIIGTVSEVHEEKTDISSYATIKPGVVISDVTSCMVVTNFKTPNKK